MLALELECGYQWPRPAVEWQTCYSSPDVVGLSITQILKKTKIIANLFVEIYSFSSFCSLLIGFVLGGRRKLQHTDYKYHFLTIIYEFYGSLLVVRENWFNKTKLWIMYNIHKRINFVSLLSEIVYAVRVFVGCTKR
jgi:hypothetical protein